MTSLEQCFMLEKSLRLTFQTMLAVYKSGFTSEFRSLRGTADRILLQ